MKLIASLIIGVSLVFGLVGTYTAYLPPLTLPDTTLVGLELNGPAGVDPDDPTERTPLAKRGDTVTAELLAVLRAQNVTRINVKEFALGRWTGWPLFLLGSIGMVVGAMMLRQYNQRTILLQTGPVGAAAAGSPAMTEASFEAIRRGVEQLRRELPGLQSNDKLRAILEIFGEAQRTHIPAFVAARPALTVRLGLAGYAQLMDSFAAAERQLNRAWSAAADGVLDEALDCVENAHELLAEAEAKLN
jgi:hypothetical protein